MPDTLAPPPAEPPEGKLPAQPNRPTQATSNWMSGLGELSLSPAPATPAASPTEGAAPADTDAADAAPVTAAKDAAASGKPAAAPVVEPPSDPEDRWPRSAVEWKKFRESRKEKETQYEATIKARDERIAALEKAQASGTSAELEAVKKLNEELSRRIQVLDVTMEPRFEAYFAGKTSAQLELSKRIVGPALAPRVEAALKAPDSSWRNGELEEIFGELSPTQQSRLGGVLNALEGIAAERQSEIDTAAAGSAQLKAQREKAQKDHADQMEALVKETITAAGDAKEGIAPYQRREGDSTWNNAVDARISHARNILSGKGLKPNDIVKAAFYAAALPAILQDNLTLRGEIEKLQAQVKTLSAATPKLEAANPAAVNGAPASAGLNLKTGTRPMEASRAWAEAIVKAAQGAET